MHTEWIQSNTWCPLFTAAIIWLGLAVHVNGFGAALVSTTDRLMAAWRSMTERKTPHFNRRRLRPGHVTPRRPLIRSRIYGCAGIDTVDRPKAKE